MRLTLIFIILFFVNSMAQTANNNVLSEYEDELTQLFDSLYKFDGIKFYQPDHVKDSLNNEILKIFNDALSQEGSENYNFTNIKNLGVLKSDDNKLMIINWNIKYKAGNYKYFGFIKHYNKKKKRWDLFELKDRSDSMIDVEHITLTPDLWYGVLYYKIIKTKSGGTTYYTLLGWDGNNYLSQKKVIDVLYFTRSGRPRFGKSIFKIGRKKFRRIIFEYSSQVVMALNYDENFKRIVFDHLRPSERQMKNVKMFYVPDGSYDAFEWIGGKWIFIDDFNAVNPKTKEHNKLEFKSKKLYDR